jgi:hypothetical protein
VHKISIVKPGIVLGLAKNTVTCKIKNKHKDDDVQMDKGKPPIHTRHATVQIH